MKDSHQLRAAGETIEDEDLARISPLTHQHVIPNGTYHFALSKPADDTFERGDSSFLYDDWMVHRVYLVYGAQAFVAQWLQSFKEFPPRQRPASFNLDQVMRKLSPQASQD